MADFRELASIIGEQAPEFWGDVMGRGVSGALIGFAAGGFYGWGTGSGFFNSAVKTAMGGLAIGAGVGTDKALQGAYGKMLLTPSAQESFKDMAAAYRTEDGAMKSVEELTRMLVGEQTEAGKMLEGISDEQKAELISKLQGHEDWQKALGALETGIDPAKMRQSATTRSGLASFWDSWTNKDVQGPAGIVQQIGKQQLSQAVRPAMATMSSVWRKLNEPPS